MIKFHCQAKMHGFFRLQTFESGVCTKDTGFFENLITNQGLDQVGLSPYIGAFNFRYINTHCSVGTGNTPPTYSDTQLTAYLARTPTTSSGIEGAQKSSYTTGTPPYYSQIWTYTFATGAAAGNLTEVGVGVYVTGYTQPALFSHALILDGLGNPTTISVTSTEILVVTYELRLYLNITDNTYSFTLNGTTTESGTYRIFDEASPTNYYYDMSDSRGSDILFGLSTNALQPVTGSPNWFSLANLSTGTSITGAAYFSGNYFREYTATFNTSAARGTINLVGINCPLGKWQFSVSPAINFSAGYSLQMSFSVSWARY